MAYPIKPIGDDILPFDTIFAENNNVKIAMTSGEILDGYNNDGDIETALTSTPDANRFNMFWYQVHNTIKWLVGYTEELYAQKFDKSGGSITGNVAMGNKKITTTYVPASPEDLTNKEYVDKAINSGLWLGEIKMLSYPSIPQLGAGIEVVPCDGRAISRTTYADYFALIGTSFGSGDGNTTFNIPDYRGLVVRGWDGGSGRDTGRVYGSIQNGNIPQHTHTFNGNTGGQSANHTHTRGTMEITGHVGSWEMTGLLPVGDGAFRFYYSGAGYSGGYGGGFGGAGEFVASRSWTGNTSGASQGHTHSYSGTTSDANNSLYTNKNEVIMANGNCYYYVRIK